MQVRTIRGGASREVAKGKEGKKGRAGRRVKLKQEVDESKNLK